MHLYFQYLNCLPMSNSSYFIKVRLYKSVSFCFWLTFTMYQSSWTSICILSKISIMPRLITLLLRWVGRLVPFKPGLTTPVGWLVTPTDRSKSVRNRCVIDDFGGVCVFYVGIGGFVIGLGQISFFFSLH